MYVMLVQLMETSVSHLSNVFHGSSVPSGLKAFVIVPFSEDKGLKASNKDCFCGISLFWALCKVFEMILLNKLKRLQVNRAFSLQYNVSS